jgi:antitoxin ParD1/3/4
LGRTILAETYLELLAPQIALIDRLIASGRYRNLSDAIGAALRLLEREEAELASLRGRVALGLKEARRAEFVNPRGELAIRQAFAAVRGKA